jgi:endonuclease/exonuclease/phosphatase family metal-dependent hydrolase
MTGLVAVILMALTYIVLLARVTGGYPPTPRPQLAALAPAAIVPAALAVALAAVTVWWLAVLAALPLAALVIFQLPWSGRLRSHGTAKGMAKRARRAGTVPSGLRLQVLTVNAQGGAADPARLVSVVRENDVDVLAIQELTPHMVSRLARAGIAQLLPFSHLDPRPGSPGTGLWARWPLTPLPPLPGLTAAAPQASVDPAGGRAVTVTAVHTIAPLAGHAYMWRRELAQVARALTAVDGPQVIAGDFNASRDHRSFREILAAGFVDCADASLRRRWLGFTWPADGGRLPVMRLDHVLVPRTATVHSTRAIRLPQTDHLAVLATIEFT